MHTSFAQKPGPALPKTADKTDATRARTPAQGNQARLRRLQAAKPGAGDLELGPVDSPLEREADRIAARITGTSSQLASPSPPCNCGTCDACSAKGEAGRSGHGSAPGGGHVPAIVHDVLRGSGQKLDPSTRAWFEPRLGRTLADVRLHIGSRAAESADALDARAYTVGSDIVFGPGMFGPATPAGRNLLAHELAHVGQQAAGRRLVQRQPRDHPHPPTAKPSTSEIVKIVADQDSIAAIAFFADGTSGDITLVTNKVEPGEYVVAREGGATGGIDHYSGTSREGKPLHGFKWTGRGAEKVTIVVIPRYVRDFLVNSTDSHAQATVSKSELLAAAQLLTRYHVGETELILEKERQINDRALNGNTGGAGVEDWALSFVGTREKAEQTAVADFGKLTAAAKRLANANNDETQLAVARAESESREDDVYNAAALQNASRRFEWRSFDNYADLNATADAFSAGLEGALHALTEGMLNEAAATILQVQRTYIGTSEQSVGYGYLDQALDKARQDKDVQALLPEIAKTQARVDRLDQKLALQLPQIPGVHESPEAGERKEAGGQLDTQRSKLNRLLGDRWNIHISGVQGVRPEALLAEHADKAQSMLALGLADSLRKIGEARRKLRADSKFVFKADRVVALEKKQLGITAGQPLDRIVDAIVKHGASPTSFWGDLWEVISFVVGFVPPPAGPIMRAVVSGINLAAAFDENAGEALAHDTGLASKGPTSLAGTVLVTAAGSLFDAGELTGLASAERETVSLGLEAGSFDRQRFIGTAEATFAQETARTTGTSAATVESEIAELERAASQPGRVRRPEGQAIDAEMTTAPDSAGDVHTYERQADTDIWCRHSEEGPCNPLPKLSEEVDKAKAGQEAEAAAAAAAPQAVPVLTLGEGGLPIQIHDLQHPVGPAFATRAEAEAVIGANGHVLEVVVEADGQTTTWFEASEGGLTPVGDEAHVEQLGHTEQKALHRINPRRGVKIEFRGNKPPCPWGGGCMNTMQLAARSGARITYRQILPNGNEAIFTFTGD